MVKVPSSCRHSSHGMAPVSPCRRVDLPCVDAVPPSPLRRGYGGPPGCSLLPWPLLPWNPNPSPLTAAILPPPAAAPRRHFRPPRSQPTLPQAPRRQPLPPPRAVRAREPPVARIDPVPPTMSAAVRIRSRRRSSSSAFTKRAVVLRVRCSSSRTPWSSSCKSRSR